MTILLPIKTILQKYSEKIFVHNATIPIFIWFMFRLSLDVSTQQDWIKPVVLNSGWFCPSDDIWQCLKTLWIVITGE